MSPVVKRKGERVTIPGKYLLFLLTILCTTMMLVTFGITSFNKPFNMIIGYVVMPFEKGIGKAGNWFVEKADELASIKSLQAENEELKKQVAELTEENTLLNQDKYELNQLRELFDLDKQYDSYDKIGARVIARDAGNWYATFLIDRGSADGIMEDMNVISGGGLVGRISQVGPNWSKVTSIICDNSNVSAMTLSTNDNMIVSGDLKSMSDGVIPFSQMVDSKNKVEEGDKVVTSNISDKYLPNILVGYIQKINLDNNNLTKSGYLIPAVDFEHISEVLVIVQQKQTIEE